MALSAAAQIGKTSERLSPAAKKFRYKEKMRVKMNNHRKQASYGVQVRDSVTVTSTAADREGLRREREPVRLFSSSTKKAEKNFELPLQLISSKASNK